MVRRPAAVLARAARTANDSVGDRELLGDRFHVGLGVRQPAPEIVRELSPRPVRTREDLDVAGEAVRGGLRLPHLGVKRGPSGIQLLSHALRLGALCLGPC